MAWLSYLILFAEQIVPKLLVPCAIILVFLTISWFDTAIYLTFWLRITVCAGFAIALGLSLAPFIRISSPDYERILHRLEIDNNLHHRPLTQLNDSLSAEQANGGTPGLWRAHRERLTAKLKKIRPVTPLRLVPELDPYALRTPIILFAIVAFISSGEDTSERLGNWFRPADSMTSEAIRVDAWINPPAYSGRPTIILKTDQHDVTVLAGSSLTISASSSRVKVFLQSEHEEINLVPIKENPDHFEYATTLSGNAHLRIESGNKTTNQWNIKIQPDNPPVVRWVTRPEILASGAFTLTYSADDDFGLLGLDSRIETETTSRTTRPARPLYPPPNPDVIIPQTRKRTTRSTVKLTSHPWAGSTVKLSLVATDAVGQKGYSDPIVFELPKRHFANPLAKALVEQRRILALDANNRLIPYLALEAILAEPDLFDIPFGAYLGLREIFQILSRNKSDEDLRDVADGMWDLAMMLDVGSLTDLQNSLSNAKEALKKALINGSSEKEIAALTKKLREALNQYLNALAERGTFQSENAQSAINNQNSLTNNDFNRLLDQLENYSRNASKENAQQLLSDLDRLIESLMTGQPSSSQASAQQSELNQLMNDLGRLMQKQQELMSETFKNNTEEQQRPPQAERSPNGTGGPDEFREPSEEQIQAMKDLAKKQDALKKELDDIRDAFAQQGAQPNGQAMQDAGEAMDGASQELRDGSASGALEQQAKAMQALRKGARQMVDSIMQSQQGQGRQSQNATGRRTGQRDPLGRALRSDGWENDLSVKIPDEFEVERARQILEELKKRLGNPKRPQLERNYLERLIEQF